MLDRQYDLSSLQDAINQSNHLAILFPTAASLDTYAAGISLASGLKKIGRTTSLIAASLPDNSITRFLPAAANISTQLTGGDLVMSFPYKEGAIDKVSYHIDNDQFYLIIKPKPGFPPVTRKAINFDEAGPEPDHYIILDLNSLTELGQLYQDHKSRLTPDKIIQFSITQSITSSEPVKISISDKQAVSLSEMVFRTLQGLSIKLDPAIASAIILGIETQTASLSQPNLSADVFAIISACLRAGGSRTSSTKPPLSVKSPISQPISSQPVTLQPMSTIDSASQSPQEPSWVLPVNSA